MRESKKLAALGDDVVLARLERAVAGARRLCAEIIVLLLEVEERRLDLKTACPSLFEFCVRRLGMSNGTAFRHITAARLARRFPTLIGRIERGEVHLSALAQLRDYLTAKNVDQVIDAARGKNRYEVAELVARLSPRPDLPSRMRKIPTARTAAVVSPAHRLAIEPLTEARYRVQFTASRTLRDKIGYVRDLMRHSNPTGDLEAIFEYAVDAAIERLRKTRRAAIDRQPERQGTDLHAPTPAAKQPTISRAVRREVFARDGEQCTFVDAKGRRCDARGFLQLDHVKSRALGGSNGAQNLRVRCFGHNHLHAEETFGKNYINSRIHLRQRKRSGVGQANGNSKANEPAGREAAAS